MSNELTNKKMPAKKTGLGRGLGSLLGENSVKEVSEEKKEDSFAIKDFGNIKKDFQEKVAQTSPPQENDESRVWKIRIDRVVPNASQPRKAFEKEALESLANSIKEKGILQPITARKIKGEKFQIIAGERRWRAAQKAGLQEVPVILKNTDDQDVLELALIENIQRENLNPIEEAEAYFYLVKTYKLTQQELADKIGKDRATVANMLRLLNLSPEVRKMLAENELSMGQARALVSVSDPKMQKSLAQKAKALSLSVRAIEKLVAKTKETKTSASIQDMDVSDKLMKGLADEMQKMLATKVAIDYAGGKGKITIKFYSDGELNQVVDKLRSAWQR